jgi:ATP/maltotriose-dependent transcriptional regulator MalT
MYAEKEVYIDKYLKIAQDRSKITGEYEGLRGDFPAVRAYAAHRRGDYDKAYSYAHEALKWLPENNYPVRSGIHFILGRIYSKRDDFPNALPELEKASILGEKSGNLSSAVNALCSAGAIHIQLGNLGDAENVFTQAKRIATGPSGNPMPFASTVLGCLADFHVDYGDLDKAKNYALETVDLGKKWLNGDSQVRGLLALARVAHFQDQSHEAYQYLEKAKKISATNILVSDAIQGIDQTEKFLQSQTFRKIRVNQDTLSEPLTERELEVLQLLAAGMSNRAIAEELVIAIGTTKAHISRIMGKLNAKNRTQAVVLARELRLISSRYGDLKNETSS